MFLVTKIFYSHYIVIIFNYMKKYIYYLIKMWGLGIGDWGLGIGDWAQSPIPNPQSPSPIPNIFIK
jgi:hypothetical protein